MSIECRKIEEAPDSVHIQQMRFLWMAREAHRDHRPAGQELVALPRMERQCRQQLVLADHDVRIENVRRYERLIQANSSRRIDTKVGEESGEMPCKEAMPADAQSS